jgi:hypothetical protein
VVTSSREGGASLNILSGFVAGNFSAYWLGLTIMGLMTGAYFLSSMDLSSATIGGEDLMVLTTETSAATMTRSTFAQ